MPDRSDHNRLNRDNPFQLHYFPEIPLRKTSSEPARPNAGNRFQPFGSASGDTSPVDGECFAGTPTEAAGDTSHLSAADIEKQAYNRGFSKGEKAGLAAAAVQLDAALAALNQALDETRRLQETLHRHAEKEIVELALGIARKIIAREVHIDHEIIVAVIRSALEKANDCRVITIKINPADYEFLESNKDRLRGWIDSDRITFKQDGDIETGGCLIETDCGDIDARLDSRLEVIADSLRTKLKP